MKHSNLRKSQESGTFEQLVDSFQEVNGPRVAAALYKVLRREHVLRFLKDAKFAAVDRSKLHCTMEGLTPLKPSTRS